MSAALAAIFTIKELRAEMLRLHGIFAEPDSRERDIGRAQEAAFQEAGWREVEVFLPNA